MPMQDSLNFIREMRTTVTSKIDLPLEKRRSVQSFLVSNGYHFTHDEFEVRTVNSC
jgi:hypothetical protein